MNDVRILMLNHNVAWSGGTFFRAYHFARQMVRRGHRVTLLSISRQNRFGFTEYVRDGVQIVETPDWLWGRGRTGWDIWDTLCRIRFVRKQTWDLVHAFDSRPAVVLPALSVQKRDTPLVMDWADWWGRGGTIEERATGSLVRVFFGPVETFFEESFRHRADGTTVISAALHKRVLALGVPPQSVECIPQGSDTEHVRPLAKRACRLELGLPETTPIVGYLGVLTKSDAQLLFDTFAHLLARQTDCTLLLIGNHKAIIPCRRGVLETGFVSYPQMVQYLGACDLMLLPLKDTIASRGRWPSKINDYLAAGRPVVASAVGDVQDLFLKHSIGRATCDTPDALAEAADELLSNDALQGEMGYNARQVAETELAWPYLAERLDAHYSKFV